MYGDVTAASPAARRAPSVAPLRTVTTLIFLCKPHDATLRSAGRHQCRSGATVAHAAHAATRTALTRSPCPQAPSCPHHPCPAQARACTPTPTASIQPIAPQGSRLQRGPPPASTPRLAPHPTASSSTRTRPSHSRRCTRGHTSHARCSPWGTKWRWWRGAPAPWHTDTAAKLAVLRVPCCAYHGPGDGVRTVQQR